MHYKNIGGKRYFLHPDVQATSKDDAERRAKKLRADGFIVRLRESKEYRMKRFRGDTVGRPYRTYEFWCRIPPKYK